MKPHTVTITSLTENYVDMLLADAKNVRRAGLAHHFDPKKLPPVAENGIALHVEVKWGISYSYRLLFDTGMTGDVLTHNAQALDIDLTAVDHVVLSHGHPDHYGGLTGFLGAREAPVPVAVHPDAFLPRYLRLASGQVAPFYNHDLSADAIDAAGGSPLLHTGPVEVGPGLLASGPIPRDVAFEAPPTRIDGPNALIQLRDGEMVPDVVPDDQALIIEVGRDGFILLVGCSHAGIINTLRHAVRLTGRKRVLAVMGGFHLGFPGTPDSKTAQTIDALEEYDIELLCPMHCTGMRAMMQLADAFPESFLLNCTGTCVHLHDRTTDDGAHDHPYDAMGASQE